MVSILKGRNNKRFKSKHENCHFYGDSQANDYVWIKLPDFLLGQVPWDVSVYDISLNSRSLIDIYDILAPWDPEIEISSDDNWFKYVSQLSDNNYNDLNETSYLYVFKYINC